MVIKAKSEFQDLFKIQNIIHVSTDQLKFNKMESPFNI